MNEREILDRIAAHPVDGTPEAMRAAFEALADLPVDLRGCTLTHRTVAGTGVDVLTPPGGPGPARIVYLHGGGYVFGSARSHRRPAVELAIAGGCELWLPDYPLAPEHPWPAQRRCAADVVRAAAAGEVAVGDAGVDDSTPGRCPVVLGGDSAGGHLALATLLAGGPDMPRVAGAVLFSPNTLRDYSLTRTRTANAGADAMNDPDRDDALARTAFGEGDPADPERTLVHAALDALPPLHLDVGGDEVLLDDTLVFGSAAARAGVRVDLHVRPDTFHMSQLFAQHWQAADDSLRRAGAWVADRTSRTA